MVDLLYKLNSVQVKAVQCVEDPCLIIAGPGSGKTKVLTTKIAYLITEKKVNPGNIMALTFTNKAANEMIIRLRNLSDTNIKQLFIGTFHSCFSRILRINADKIGYTANFSIFDTSDSKNIIASIIKNENLDKDIYAIDKISSKISKCKSNIITAEEYGKNEDYISEDEKNKIPMFAKIYKKYEVECKNENAMDFDELLLNTYMLLKNNNDIREKYQKQFQYLFIDEFQDTSILQYEIAKIISAKSRNICVVGDDAQSIYAFRGATIDNILNFKKDFKDCSEFKLEQNYRSTKSIVNTANSIIKNNKKQISKQITTENGEGEKLHLISALTPSEEARAVVRSIDNDIKTKKILPSEVAILYRTNAQAVYFENELNKNGIKYKILGGISFYQRKVVKDFISYLRVIVNTRDSEAIKRSINEPRRGLGGNTLDKIYKTVDEKGMCLWDAFVSDKNLFDKKSKFLLSKYTCIIQDAINNLNTKNAYEIATDICAKTEYLGKLKDKKNDLIKEEYDTICELLDSIKSFVEDKNNTDKSLQAYLRYLPLNNDKEDTAENDDYISLMTVHSAKGLEFKCVYVVGLQEGIFPSIKKKTVNVTETVEEERRLFYVAITRAKEMLFLSFSRSIFNNGFTEMVERSRFINEINSKYFDENGERTLSDVNEKSSKIVKDYAKYSVFNYSIVNKRMKVKKPVLTHEANEGSVIFHPQYGKGVLVAVLDKEAHLMKVSFEKYGIKELVYNPEKIFVYA